MIIVKTLVYHVFGDMLPPNVGNKRAMLEYLRFVAAQPEWHTILCIVGDVSPEHRKVYEDMGAEVKTIPPNKRWSIWEIFNKISSRLDIDMLWTFFSALSYRRRFSAIAANADVVLMTYACWFPMLDSRSLASKTFVLTLDLLFYRRASIGGLQTPRKRFMYRVNRRCELHVLNKFRKICVLGEYEADILRGLGVPSENLIQIGMPLAIKLGEGTSRPFRSRKFDFFIISGGGRESQNLVRKFAEEVLPLIGERKASFAMVGKICHTTSWIRFPPNVTVVRLGPIDDPEEIFANARIAVGTVTNGSGIKVKVVEMAMHDLPVVVTDKGAEGIPLTGRGFINVDHATPDQIRKVLLTWLDNPDIAERDGRETGSALRQSFHPDVIMAGLKRSIMGASPIK